MTVSLRLVTYNVLDGGTGREDLLLEVVRTASPDILLLQEIQERAFVDRLAEALSMQMFFAQGNSAYHLALLSRWPIVAGYSHHPYPPIQQTILEATVELPTGRRLAVFGIHPVPLPSVLFELWRLWEIKIALGRVRRQAPTLCVIAGDFNACAPGDKPKVGKLSAVARALILLQGGVIFRFALRAVLNAGMFDCFREMNGDADGFTFGPPRPIGRIDYIFANAGMRTRLRACSVVRQPTSVDRASDHYPVVAIFDL